MNLRNCSKAFKKFTAGIVTVSMILSMFVIGGIQVQVAADAQDAGVTTPANIVSLISPDYRSELNGVTDLKVAAPGGYTYAKAYYTGAPDAENPHPLGHTVTIGPADLDANGIGTIQIDSNKMPNGPVMVMVEAFKPDGTSCNGYFQFFNLVGEEWNAGLNGRDESIPGNYDPEIALPDFINQNQAAIGKPAMQTVFADDMNYKDNNDLKAHISRDGIGKTYGGHYPNHKDDRAGFFGPEKGDEGGQEQNPYRAVKGENNNYLLMIDRVHDEPTGAADWGGLTKYMTSPCLSSIDEEGHSASLPEYPDWDGWTNGYTEQYLETRVFFGPNPGTWPAFWTLSNGPWKDPETGEFIKDDDGGKSGWRGTDEIDIVEAWHSTNSFSINTHTWGYTPLTKDGESFGSGVKGFTSSEVLEKAGTDALVGDFQMGFHTYGCYITEETTYYFLDGELIGSHATMPLSWRDGNRWLLNTGIDATKHQAFPEGYGFTRYGDANYTYVDWVRIWEAPIDAEKPLFDVEYEAIETKHVMPGETLTFKMSRQNEAAKKAAVTYNVDLPEGWEIVGNNSFGPLTGDNTQDTLTVSIPADYIKHTEKIAVTPVVDGKEYAGPYIRTQNDDTSFGVDKIYPYYVAENNSYDVYVQISNDDTAKITASAGTMTLKSPDGTEKVVEFPALAPGETCMLPAFKDVSISVDDTQDFVFELVREDGFERTIERKLSGLTAFKAEDFDFGSDGTAFDLSQWDGGMPVKLTQYEGAATLTGEDDLSVSLYTKWSDNFLYIAAVAIDDDLVTTNTEDWGGLWDGDSVQLSFDPTRSEGYANELGKEHIRLTGGINNKGVGGLGLETFLFNDYKASDIKTNFFRDEDSKTTYYMMAIPWGAILENGAPVVDDVNVTEDLGFTLLINDRDGADSRGWMRYMNGIGSGKKPQEFGDLILSNAEKPGTSSTAFVDVNSSDWFYGDVNYAVTKGLFNGTSDNEFSPEDAMTRAMFVTVLHRMDAAEPVTADNPFNDVASDAYFAEAVKWAAANKIVNGVSADWFGSDEAVSRQDIAVMLTRYLDFIGADVTVTEEYISFADEDAISDYAKDAVQMMNKLGIITGKGDNVIDPQSSATRAEVAAMLHRFLENSAISGK